MQRWRGMQMSNCHRSRRPPLLQVVATAMMDTFGHVGLVLEALHGNERTDGPRLCQSSGSSRHSKLHSARITSHRV